MIKQIAKLALGDKRFVEKFIPAFLEAYYSGTKNLVVVEEKGQLVAFAHFWMITNEALNNLRDLQFNPERMKKTIMKRGDNLHIVSIVVDENYRNNGLIFKMREKAKQMEPEAKTWSWLNPEMTKLCVHKIIRR